MKLHFLDSNIFLSISTSDSAKNICESYFELNTKKFTSTTVKNESNRVISKIRDISFETLDYIDNYVSINKIPDDKIHNSLNSIKKDFLIEYEFDDCPFGIRKDKFVKIVNELFFKYSRIFNRYNPLPFVIMLDEEYSHLDGLYKKQFFILRFLFKQTTVNHFHEEVGDELIIELLNDDGIHNPDARILLDAYKTSKMVQDYLIFITNDAGIINKSDIVLSNLESKVICKKPEEFLNN
ncbi:hypothetical protein [Methanobrevibacter sp.]